ncbi:MAG: hypothetical protein Unbinned5081contig1002_37 [Prokaryotic dsDNA virus sp.]|nr:MAG: hypothetical protein Unbinned5081contig1002_37 [Prokaryotic dsDNA virus sp.]|tara:strand:+ start:29328 stop:30107 length:780 start_codon:yes stop_codon:yes gene_type:complete
MKKILSTVVITTLISSNAFAFGNSTTNNNQQYGGNAAAGAIAGAAAGSKSKSNAEQSQGQSQGQIGVNTLDGNVSGYNKNTLHNKIDDSGNSESNSGVYGSGNSANLNAARTSGEVTSEVNIGGDNFEAPKIPANSVFLSNLAANECSESATGGVNGLDFGFGFGASYGSTPCWLLKYMAFNAEFNKGNKEMYNLVNSMQCGFEEVKEAYKAMGVYNKYCVGAKETIKKGYFGLLSTKAYEDVCKYPTEECRRFKAGKL